MIRCVTGSQGAIQRLAIAFRACPKDFEELKAEVKNGNVSVYELSGDGYEVTIAGEVIGDSYYLWGVAGRGVVPAIKELAQYVKTAGLNSISAETYFPAVARLVKKLNTTENALTHTTQLNMSI